MEAKAMRASPSPRRMALCAAALAAAGLAAMFFPSSGGGETPVLARAEKWEIRRGAPEGGGRETTLPEGAVLTDDLLLIGPRHPLPEDYPAPSTRGVRAMVGSYVNADPGAVLRQEVIYALSAMEFDYPWSQGAKVTEGALSAAQLEDRRRDALRRYAGILPVQEAVAMACQAAPGAAESEHRTGCALDIVLLGTLEMSRPDPLLRSETGRWLADNMWRYGFIRRYGPEDGRAEGYCESIHLRYVGKVHAAAMRILNMGLEDYVLLLRREGALTLYRDGAPWAFIACAPQGAPLRVFVPEGGECRLSGDNAGYIAAAVSYPSAPEP